MHFHIRRISCGVEYEEVEMEGMAEGLRTVTECCRIAYNARCMLWRCEQ